ALVASWTVISLPANEARFFGPSSTCSTRTTAVFASTGTFFIVAARSFWMVPLKTNVGFWSAITRLAFAMAVSLPVGPRASRILSLHGSAASEFATLRALPYAPARQHHDAHYRDGKEQQLE